MKKNNIYARPQVIKDINDCYFYHTVDLPGDGVITGEWDLRKGMKQYLGG